MTLVSPLRGFPARLFVTLVELLVFPARLGRRFRSHCVSLPLDFKPTLVAGLKGSKAARATIAVLAQAVHGLFDYTKHRVLSIWKEALHLPYQTMVGRHKPGFLLRRPCYNEAFKAWPAS